MVIGTKKRNSTLASYIRDPNDKGKSKIVRSVQRFQGRQVNVTKSTDTTIDPKRWTDGRKDGRLAGSRQGGITERPGGRGS